MVALTARKKVRLNEAIATPSGRFDILNIDAGVISVKGDVSGQFAEGDYVYVTDGKKTVRTKISNIQVKDGTSLIATIHPIEDKFRNGLVLTSDAYHEAISRSQSLVGSGGKNPYAWLTGYALEKGATPEMIDKLLQQDIEGSFASKSGPESFRSRVNEYGEPVGDINLRETDRPYEGIIYILSILQTIGGEESHSALNKSAYTGNLMLLTRDSVTVPQLWKGIKALQHIWSSISSDLSYHGLDEHQENRAKQAIDNVLEWAVGIYNRLKKEYFVPVSSFNL